MNDAMGILSRHMKCAVDGEACWINNKGTLIDSISLHINFNETGGCDFIKQHAVAIGCAAAVGVGGYLLANKTTGT